MFPITTVYSIMAFEAETDAIRSYVIATVGTKEDVVEM